MRLRGSACVLFISVLLKDVDALLSHSWGSNNHLLLILMPCHTPNNSWYLISRNKLGDKEAGAVSDLAKHNL